MGSIFRNFEPKPFRIALSGKVNGDQISVHGVGTIPRLGQYDAMLNFSSLPQDFHPSAIATYTVSICCVYNAAMRNRALNIAAMGAEGYSTRRVLPFGKEQILIEGDIHPLGGGFEFEGKISGEAKLPRDLAQNSIYIKRISPESGNRLIGVGEGSLFRINGREFPVRIDTVHTLRPKELANRLKKPEIHIVTESKQLIGLTYKTQIHSVVDGQNTMSKMLSM